MIVAEQVVAALEGGLVTNAVNIPAIGADDLEVLGPFVPLAAEARPARRRARRRRARADRPRRTTARSPSYDTRLLTVAALNGAFPGRVDQPVNYVNAPLDRRRARDRGREEQAARLARLHEPRPRLAPTAVARRRDDDRPRAPPLARARRSASRSTSSSRRGWSSSATTTCPA